MHRDQEHLIPGGVGGAAASSRGNRREQQQNVRSPSDRASKSASARPTNSNRLLENFGEFLATRNVITSNSTDLNYDKLVSDSDDLSMVDGSGRDQSRNESGHWSLRAKSKLENSRRKQQKPIRRTKHGIAQHGTVSMLAALFSPTSAHRTKDNRKSILLYLIRAPTFLAALFSLLLVVTLIVLYALSFGHHHQQPANSSSTNRPPAGENLAPASLNHRISSRDLPAHSSRPPEASSIGQLNDDDDDDDEPEQEQEQEQEQEDENATENNSIELPEGLSRALSVQSECGPLVGSAEDNGVVFRAIPYASPPIGPRRWRRPQPIWLDRELCGSGRRRADLGPNDARARPGGRSTRSGERGAAAGRRARRARHCAQLNPITNRFAGQEDCLYLDIYLPRLDQTKRLPVMVYIHGGFLAFGSSSGQPNWMKAKPSARLAAELDVIVVAFNYRLQALGFMTLAPPANEPGSAASGEPIAGNFGLWDQLTALNWIKRNIESFGGDPNNIVLFGPDSASSLVWALLGNRERPPAPNDSRQAGTQLRNLFRAAWLTNPTIYQELGQELAGQHYQRLFQNQLACLLGLESGPNGTSAPAKGEASKLEPRGRQDNLKDCLMQLSAEQVMRHYLGNDHPSYRLDDQNSLPIHGIFVDQFVTIDGELVRESFPFVGASLDSKPTNQSGGCNSLANSTAGQLHEEQTNLPKSSAPVGPQSDYAASTASNATNETTRGDYKDERTAHKEAASNFSGSQRREDVDSPGPSSPPIRGPETIDLLIGSSAQAVEHWPCPRNLNQWTWDDFKRYVATSLNSFATDLYMEASSLYGIPKSRDKTNIDKQQHSFGPSPAWTYLTMVSDIRQICPINELTNKLVGASGNGLSVHRYIVESSPSNATPTMSTKEDSDVGARTRLEAAPSAPNDHYADLDHQPSGRPKFAYHTKDLLAFFGYEFDPTFRPQTGDLKFQSKIRQMVRQFVYKQQPADDANKQIAILDGNGATRFVDKYRHSECSMWQRHLGKSYAWLS